MDIKQELVQLAKDKGFVATFVHDKPFIYSSKEPLRWLFWMTELQKWLRDGHRIDIDCDCDYEREFWKFGFRKKGYSYNHYPLQYKSFEEALEAGLFEALKLLKDE